MSKKNKATNQQKLLSPTAYIKTRARNLPIHECYVNHDWEASKMANIFIARKHSNGNKTFGFYLVDLFCLGVKDSFYKFNIDNLEYDEMLSKLLADDFLEIDYILAHNIIFAGVEFASEFGILPCKEFNDVTKFMLEVDNDDIDLIEIECGHNNKPMLVVGPENKIELQKTIAHLEKKVGSNGFIVREVSDDWDGEDELDDEIHFMARMESLSYNEDNEHFNEWLNEDIDKLKKALKNKHLDKSSDHERADLVLILESLFVNLNSFKKIETCYFNIQKALYFSIFEGDNIPERLIAGSNKIMPATLESYRNQLNDFFSTAFKSQRKEFNALEKLAKKYPQILYFQLLTFNHLMIEEKPKDIKACIANIEKIDPSYWLLDTMKQYILLDISTKIDTFERMLNGENLVDVFRINFDIVLEEKFLLYSMFFKYLLSTNNIAAFTIFVNSEYSLGLADQEASMDIESTLIAAQTLWVLQKLNLDGDNNI